MPKPNSLVLDCCCVPEAWFGEPWPVTPLPLLLSSTSPASVTPETEIAQAVTFGPVRFGSLASTPILSPAVTEPTGPLEPLASPMKACTVLEMSVTEIDTPMPTWAAVMIAALTLIVMTRLSAKTVTSSPALTTASSSIHALATTSTS